ncbi:GNAT family N-acetyltransferase [Paenibacillus sp. P96]|uniref:GNAT family N-acetyltransferase n=2 Tax=Paenibacillus zeirhizosphaerae TaxID=2987519 RepID=A0ABT9FLP5_9BACL|nr:GNAT family protein [Paenibacillus sp. P96]MDP4095604.1 GNAT family N-acetyltransferase [Paenibacillus sp. P96]
MYECKGNIPILQGSRVRLRKMEAKDARQVFTFWSDCEVTRYMNIESMSAPEDAEDMILLLNRLSRSEDAIRWGIELKENGELIGSCGFNHWQLDGAFKGEIGYELSRLHWRKGYMSEVLGLLHAFGFETMRLNRIEAMVDPRNEPSQRLLEAFGWTREGLLRQVQYTSTGYKDMLIYSLLYEEWLRKEKGAYANS